MSYIITEPYVGVKDGGCVEVCSVDCIHTTEADDICYINPAECIDCGMCKPVCPITAIFHEYAVPTRWYSYIAKNYSYYK